MSPSISRTNQVKAVYAVLAVAAAVYGVFRLNVRLREASVDEAVRNQLRNLYGFAREYSARHGNPPVVLVSELDAAALVRAGIRPPLPGSFPTRIIMGAPLVVTDVDGDRTVIFEPGK